MKTHIATKRAALPHYEVSVDIVIPVYNEEQALGASVDTLVAYLDTYCPYRWHITIGNNASTDSTLQVAQKLTLKDPRISLLNLDQKGRGRALRSAWLSSTADVVAYMDVDLSTNLQSFLPLIAPLVSGHSDWAVGSRLQRGAIVTRQWKREFISRCYNAMIRMVFRNGFSDAQCGFKAIKTTIAHRLIPDVENNEWFFDTELLLLAERRRLRIHEVPVDWVEDLDSRVNIVATAIGDIKGLIRLRFRRHQRMTPVGGD